MFNVHCPLFSERYYSCSYILCLQGICLFQPESLPDDPQAAGCKLIRLWTHEVYRVFYDRLSEPADRESFFAFVKVRVLYSYVLVSLDQTISKHLHFESLQYSYFKVDALLYSDDSNYEHRDWWRLSIRSEAIKCS